MNFWHTLQIAALLVLAAACTTGEDNTNEAQTEKQEIETQDSHGGELRLNDGKKWEANPETTEGIRNMEVAMAGFTPTEDPAAWMELKDDLETNFQYIFAKCTMKGEAHDQLHNFLYPMKPLFADFASENPDSRMEAFASLEKHLAIYDDYFE